MGIVCRGLDKLGVSGVAAPLFRRRGVRYPLFDLKRCVSQLNWRDGELQESDTEVREEFVIKERESEFAFGAGADVELIFSARCAFRHQW